MRLERVSIIVALIWLAAARAVSQEIASCVDPFIGTANGGNTFPGAVRPWGMVAVSPHTAPGSPSGYLHGLSSFYGFGHVHLSGTGCADLGSIIVTATRDSLAVDPARYRTSYSKETAGAGYYSIALDSIGCTAEVTATARCGLTRFTMLREGDITFLIDAGRSLSNVGGGGVRRRSPTEAEGYNLGGGFCGEANRHPVFFALRLSEPAPESGTWKGDTVSRDSSAEIRDNSVGVWFRMHARRGKQMTIKVGISYVSVRNAWLNLEHEAGLKSFEEVYDEAVKEWEDNLGRIQVEGGSRQDSVKFYTALYHALIHPSDISDVNGDYPLMGHKGVGHEQGRGRYSVFSLWDTYRTLHPLLTLVYPDRQSAIIKSMLDIYQESGWLPKWELISNETYMMVGDAASVVIADSFTKGIRDFDASLAYEAMRKPSALTSDTAAPPIRAGYHEFLRYQYIPLDQDTTREWWVWGPVSTTLEYCFDDWAVGQMAKALGREKEASIFDVRSRYYRNLFDPSTQLIRPKLRNGDWLRPFNQFATEGSGSWSGAGGPGYVEGNAWHYTWFVPHDIRGLAGLFGGESKCAQKLAECFTNGQFTVNNEPDLAYPYLFTQLRGEEHRTAALVQNIMKTQFGSGPDGLPGNDDAGAISAWYVFSALGLYPACPASGVYQAGMPLFERAVIKLDTSYYAAARCSIELTGVRGDSPYIEQILLNGKMKLPFQIGHRELVQGGKVTFQIGRARGTYDHK